MKVSEVAYAAFAFHITYTSALKVTPNSPCVPLCVGTNSTDNDPNSYATENDDISCYDTDYSTTPTGQRFQSCMTCLQDSTFSQGAETDQHWFLYNLRYAFDNCIFGFPNATDIPSTPCSTSTACGGLRDALTEDSLDPNSPSYGYCDVDGADLADTSITKCASCVAATDNESYLVNFLVALQAGCNQRPAARSRLSLNGTVFSDTRIEANDASSRDDAQNQSSLSTAAFVGIAIGIVAVVGAIAGTIFVCYRMRQNRRRIRGLDTDFDREHHRPTSSLSFRCQMHVTPRVPTFPDQVHSAIEEEKKYTDSYSALGSHPHATESPVSKTISPDWEPQPQTLISTSPSFSRPGPKLRSLQAITTSPPTIPEKVHYSTSPKTSHFSPQAETPLSTTSNNSSAQLLPLRPYVPSDYGYSSPQIGNSGDGSFSTPTSATTASPLLSHRWERQQNQMSPVWEMPQREQDFKSTSRVAGALERMGVPPSPGKGKRVSNTGSPVESNEINIYFSAPPTRR